MDNVRKDWIRLLTLVLALPADAAARWANDHLPRDPNDRWFLHETISWHIIPLIVTNEMWTKAKAPAELESQLERVLEGFRQKQANEIDASEIVTVRAEIQRIIETYGPSKL